MTKEFTVGIQADQDPEQAFEAILNLRGWWSQEIDGPTDQINQACLYHYRDIHSCKLKLVEAIPGKKIEWEVLQNHFNFIKDQREWVGSRLSFSLEEKEGKTKVQFTHIGLSPELECHDLCADAWTTYITKSLLAYINTGKGNPNPKEGFGINAQLAKKWNLETTNE